ncbi:MAG: POTRA domain-containing protein [Pyrinomonadaceae bacterium]
MSLCLCSLFFVSAVHAQNKYENRPLSNVSIAFEGADKDISAAEQFRATVRSILGDTYSTVKIRDSLQTLYETGRIVSARVEATENQSGNVDLRFIIKRKTQAEKVIIKVGPAVGATVTEEQLLSRLDLLNTGSTVTDRILQNNADLIQEYVRGRGFYNAEVKYTQTPLDSPTRVTVTFQVNPNTQVKVGTFSINNIKGFNTVEGADAAKVRKDLQLQPGAYFSDFRLTRDVTAIRSALVKKGYLAPNLNEPKKVLDPEKNTIDLTLDGDIGPKVDVEIMAGNQKVGKGKQEAILPIKRDSSLEQATIVEGERRLRNYYQEQGYFFAQPSTTCSVEPPFPADVSGGVQNGTRELCSALSGADLYGKKVTVTYNVNPNRRLKLVDIRIVGTDKLTYEDVESVLDTQKASLIGIIPKLGYGRGYTSNETLASDRDRLKSIMRELGYRQAEVTVRQGVSPTGDNLIITFAVKEGIPTRITDVAITGNKEVPTAALENLLPDLEGKNYSRARARNGVRKLSEYYSNQGYYDAKVVFSIVEQPDEPNQAEDKVKLVYTVENEGKKVFINRVLINGNEMTKRGAVLKAINLTPDDVLRQTDIFTSEQNLYATDAFRSVEIKPEPAGQKADGNRLSDIIVNLGEQKPRIITYGGGYSTDEGALGFFDIRHVNLFGKLLQGEANVRMSQRQQLVQLSYLNPRFFREAKNRFAPLSISASYQRDSTVTRFFRSTFDQGTFGIVQRIDAKGNPIDVFGNKTGDPTINRLTFSAETSRTISQKSRSILFLRYRFEDVRLFNVNSLLIADLLRPDDRVRISGLVASFVRDTRENCNRKQSVLDLVQKGEITDPCRYNASDPTRGSFLTVDYNVSLPVLGANVGFNKLQATYQTYFTFKRLNNTTLAGRAILGLASVFSKKNRFTDPQFQELNGTLPISERFFAGGATDLRGFDFEGAGPRVVVVPQGIFRNTKGDIVTLNPFTVPFGGNALAIINLEARIPLNDTFQVVPFYDGGNVFRRVSDIFKPSTFQQSSVFLSNLRTIWSNTVGLGIRVKTPFGAAAVDYGYLLNPPQFLIPQADGSNAIYRLHQGQLHFRFSQSF